MRHLSFPLDVFAVFVAAVAILGSQLFPDLMIDIRYPVLALAMITVGIPHGAVDHIISSDLYDLSNSLTDQALFYLPYLALMLLMGIIWYVSPPVGFFIFLACTIYHFGQADLFYLEVPPVIKNLLYISRGIMIIGLLVFVNPQVSFPIMETIAGLALPVDAIMPFSIYFGWTMALQHILLLGIVTIVIDSESSQSLWYPVADAVLIAALFFLSEPIIAFAVYFACWHSIGHVKELKDFFIAQGRNWSVAKFYKHSWLFTAMSVFGLAILYWLNTAFGSEQQMLALLFILISALTLPHMIVVQLMFDTKQTISERTSG
jgi:Brp/Blh family beta-carotene 15,15'-monooxygenase